MRGLGLLIKLLVLAVVIAAGVYIYNTCAGTAVIEKIDKSLPSIEAAPFQVTTQTKIYYTKQAILNDDGSVTMLGWYERDGSKWISQKEPVTLPPVLNPKIGKR